jgi:hypothetical protein
MTGESPREMTSGPPVTPLLARTSRSIAAKEASGGRKYAATAAGDALAPWGQRVD